MLLPAGRRKDYVVDAIELGANMLGGLLPIAAWIGTEEAFEAAEQTARLAMQGFPTRAPGEGT